MKTQLRFRRSLAATLILVLTALTVGACLPDDTDGTKDKPIPEGTEQTFPKE